jgi:hypothetical protein
MEYLDMVIHETLRRYISVGVLTRVCTQAYVLPGYPNITIKARVKKCTSTRRGFRWTQSTTPIQIEAIIPERFTKEGKAQRHP